MNLSKILCGFLVAVINILLTSSCLSSKHHSNVKVTGPSTRNKLQDNYISDSFVNSPFSTTNNNEPDKLGSAGATDDSSLSSKLIITTDDNNNPAVYDPSSIIYNYVANYGQQSTGEASNGFHLPPFFSNISPTIADIVRTNGGHYDPSFLPPQFRFDSANLKNDGAPTVANRATNVNTIIVATSISNHTQEETFHPQSLELYNLANQPEERLPGSARRTRKRIKNGNNNGNTTGRGAILKNGDGQSESSSGGAGSNGSGGGGGDKGNRNNVGREDVNIKNNSDSQKANTDIFIGAADAENSPPSLNSRTQQ